MIRTVDETISVASQISPGDMAKIAAAGFVAIINNRPDNEEAGQPDARAIEAAAVAEELAYIAIPVTPGSFSSEQVESMAKILSSAHGPVLAFCRSGMRSYSLWALVQAHQGVNPDELVAKGADAGYDLSGIRPLLEQFARRG